MLIRKTQQPADYPENSIHDSYSTSQTDTYSCNYINEKLEEAGQVVYSTNEQVIGKWIDGKPLYRKTISQKGGLTNTNQTINHGIANVKIIFLGSESYISNGSFFNPIMLFKGNTDYTHFLYWANVDKTKITYKIGEWDFASAPDVCFTLYYTKTTD